MGIWTITRILRLENWLVVVMVEVRILRWEVCQGMFFVRRRLVWRLIVLVVMLLGVYCIVLLIIVVGIEGIMLLVLFIMPV